MDIKNYVLLHTTGNLYWKDKSSHYLGCNLEFSLINHLKSPEDIIGKTDAELLQHRLSEKDLKNIYTIDQYVINNCEEKTIEELGINKNGEQTYYLTKKVPLKNENGEIIGLIGNSIDITELKKIQKELESVSQVKKEFLANMRHDFRTPFCGILGIIQILLAAEKDLEKKEMLALIFDSANILLNDLNEIFEYLELENGFPILMKQFNLKETLNEIKATFLPIAEKNKIPILLELDDKLPNYLIGDKFRTKRILESLISNAFKFTQKGNIALIVKLAKNDNDKAIIKFTVQDTGIGMPEDFYNSLFEPLSRLHPSYQGIYKGKGLSLKLTKTFLDEIAGEIHVKSEAGNGSVFKVLIPYKKTLLNCAEEDI